MENSKVPSSTMTAKDRADAMFQDIITNSFTAVGDHGIPHQEIDLSWASPDLIEEGKEFYERNFAACNINVMSTVIAMYPMQRITDFLKRRDVWKEGGATFAIARASSTFAHVTQWFDRDILSRMGVGAQSVYKIRRIHKLVTEEFRTYQAPPVEHFPKKDKLLEASHQDLAFVPDTPYLPAIMTRSPEVPLSQFDMLMVIGVFFTLMDFAPERVGLYDSKGYEGYMHYIAIIGELLGIDDRFNVAKQPTAVRRIVCERIWNEIVRPCLKNFDETGFAQIRSYTESSLLVKTFVPLPAVIRFQVKHLMGLDKADNLYDQMGLYNRMSYSAFIGLVEAQKYSVIRIPLNGLMRFGLWVAHIVTKPYSKQYSPQKVETVVDV